MIEPFRIRFEDSALADLRERLARARFPDEIEGVGWDYGMPRDVLETFVEHWRTRFDWREWEARLNAFDHYRTRLPDLLGESRLHFIHQRSRHEQAFPLVITHGWPGSVLEFYKVIGPLTDPTAHGGEASDAFHIVCPSIPGYGFSDAPRTRGFDIRKLGETVAALMRELGYSAYGAQGGDWGSMATSYVGLLDAAHCRAIHLNMVAVRRPRDENVLETLTPAELEALALMRESMRHEMGYQAIQGTKPQTLGYGLSDSPLGLAAWILEKFRAWGDCGGELTERFTKDELLANVTLYWLTNSITSSTRLYYESLRSGRLGPVEARVEVPTGCAIFPREMYRPPRRWAERIYNVQRWTEMPSGGHFAALEEPQLLVDDIRAFFRRYRST
jgi:pimeloyl-ACP methyl ester carboxylesterase